MIQIRIRNARELVAREKGKWLARFAPFFVDIERMVEEKIKAEIEAALAEKQVDAEVILVADAEVPATDEN